MTFLIISLFGILFILLTSIKKIKENERLIIYRQGIFLGIKDPGLVLIIPFVDRIKRLNLDKIVPGWHELSEEDLYKRIIAYIADNPGDMPKTKGKTNYDFCRVCQHYKFNTSQGILCGLTNEKPSFISVCRDWEEDSERAIAESLRSARKARAEDAKRGGDRRGEGY